MKTKLNDFLNENIVPEGIYSENAVFNGNHYHHFGIHPVTASLYGDKVEDIKNISFVVDDDQKVYKDNFVGGGKDKADYWAWFDYSENDFTMIYPQRFLLDMCFPAGIKGTENYGQGKAYRIKIIN